MINGWKNNRKLFKVYNSEVLWEIIVALDGRGGGGMKVFRM